jgi:signal peptide peptidase SppA
MKNYPMLINALNSSVWAIMPDKLDIIMSFLSRRLVSDFVPEHDVKDAEQGQSIVNKAGSIAVLPIIGTMMQRMDWISAMSGGTSTDSIGKAFDKLVNDADISAIILEIDSPGGSVYGLEELSNKIRSARGKKPIVAVANSLMASAAYYVGSAADEISVTPGGEVGSIGTIAVHLDTSKADETEGFKYTLIKAGEFKGLGNSYEPLNKDGQGYIQGMVDQYYDMFVSAVAKNRGIGKEDVRKNYGQGKVFIASDAVKQGLADRVETLEQTIARVGRKVRYGR